MQKTSILIIEKKDISSIGLKWVIENNFDVNVKVEKEYCSQKLVALDLSAPINVVVLGDVDEKISSAITSIRQISEKIKILVLVDVLEYPKALNYLVLGASGFLTNNSQIDEIIAAVRSLIQNRIFWCAGLMEKMAMDTFNTAVQSRKGSKDEMEDQSFWEGKLTKKQSLVARYLATGEPQMAIAKRMGIKNSTIYSHKRVIFSKLRVNNFVEFIELFKKFERKN